MSQLEQQQEQEGAEHGSGAAPAVLPPTSSARPPGRLPPLPAAPAVLPSATGSQHPPQRLPAKQQPLPGIADSHTLCEPLRLAITRPRANGFTRPGSAGVARLPPDAATEKVKPGKVGRGKSEKPAADRVSRRAVSRGWGCWLLLLMVIDLVCACLGWLDRYCIDAEQPSSNTAEMFDAGSSSWSPAGLTVSSGSASESASSSWATELILTSRFFTANNSHNSSRLAGKIRPCRDRPEWASDTIGEYGSGSGSSSSSSQELEDGSRSYVSGSGSGSFDASLSIDCDLRMPSDELKPATMQSRLHPRSRPTPVPLGGRPLCWLVWPALRVMPSEIWLALVEALSWTATDCTPTSESIYILIGRLLVLPATATLMAQQQAVTSRSFKLVIRGIDENLRQVLPQGGLMGRNRVHAQKTHDQAQWVLKDGKLSRKEDCGMDFGVRLVWFDQVASVADVRRRLAIELGLSVDTFAHRLKLYLASNSAMDAEFPGAARGSSSPSASKSGGNNIGAGNNMSKSQLAGPELTKLPTAAALRAMSVTNVRKSEAATELPTLHVRVSLARTRAEIPPRASMEHGGKWAMLAAAICLLCSGWCLARLLPLLPWSEAIATNRSNYIDALYAVGAGACTIHAAAAAVLLRRIALRRSARREMGSTLAVSRLTSAGMWWWSGLCATDVVCTGLFWMAATFCGKCDRNEMEADASSSASSSGSFIYGVSLESGSWQAVGEASLLPQTTWSRQAGFACWFQGPTFAAGLSSNTGGGLAKIGADMREDIGWGAWPYDVKESTADLLALTLLRATILSALPFVLPPRPRWYKPCGRFMCRCCPKFLRNRCSCCYCHPPARPSSRNQNCPHRLAAACVLLTAVLACLKAVALNNRSSDVQRVGFLLSAAVIGGVIGAGAVAAARWRNQRALRRIFAAGGGRTAVQLAFRQFDKDGSGAIDAQELGLALAKLGFSLPSQALQTLIHKADADGSGQIEEAEFEGLVAAGGAVTLAVAEAKLRREVEQEKSEEAMAMDSVLTLNSARTEALMVGADLHPHLVAPWRQAARRLEAQWSRYSSIIFSRQKYSPPWQAAEHAALLQLAHDPLLDWSARARRLAERVPGAPLRDAASVKRRWSQLVARAAQGGWEVRRCYVVSVGADFTGLRIRRFGTATIFDVTTGFAHSTDNRAGSTLSNLNTNET